MKCTGLHCPMQHGYDVENCKLTDCKYRTMPKTNYDRIRDMSIEEMAEFITEINIRSNPKLKKSKNVIAKYIVAVKNKKWLETEVEE